MLIFFLLVFLPPNDLEHVSRHARLNYLRKAQVWHKADIPRMNTFLGPQNEISVAPGAEVRCFYVDGPPSKVGFTPKFKCRLLDSGEIVRIKFSRRETLAEVAGTRLLWALGFYTDDVYPVQLRCFDCPERNPANPGRGEARMERVIYDALMERNFSGSEIVQYPDQGWSWEELEELEVGSDQEKKAQLDALKLLAAMMQHTDSKRSQQRLACMPPDVTWPGGYPACKVPLLMIQDLGETFGTGSTIIDATSAMYFKGWSEIPVWNSNKENEWKKQNPGRSRCFASLTSAGSDGLFDPAISEAGRKFLAGLLNQISDQQIRDFSRAAGADKTGEKILQNGALVPVTVQHWVAAFKKKRTEINEKRCDQ